MRGKNYKVSKKRIFWDFSFARSGGSLVSLQHFLNQLKIREDSDLEHIIVTSLPIEAKLQHPNVKLLTISYNTKLDKFLFMTIKLHKIIKREKVDLILFAGGIPCLFSKVPFAFFVRQALYFDRVPIKSFNSKIGLYLRKLFFRIASQKSEAIFVQTNYMKTKIENEFNVNHVFKITWNVIESNYSKVRMTKQLQTPFNFLYVSLAEGRPYKNHLNLIKGFRIALDKGLEATLTLTCEKPNNRNDKTLLRIEKLIKELSLERQVVFAGNMDHENTLQLYEDADIFVFPSLSESFGVPLLEALAFGLPIVASNIAVVREVTDNSGLYFEPNDPEDISEKLIQASLNMSKLAKCSSEVFNLVYRDHDLWQDVIEKVLEILQKKSRTSI